MSTFAIDLNSSAAMWCDVPLPAEPVSDAAPLGPGECNQFLMFFAGTDGLVTTMFGTNASTVIGARSFSKLYVIFL